MSRRVNDSQHRYHCIDYLGISSRTPKIINIYDWAIKLLSCATKVVNNLVRAIKLLSCATKVVNNLVRANHFWYWVSQKCSQRKSTKIHQTSESRWRSGPWMTPKFLIVRISTSWRRVSFPWSRSISLLYWSFMFWMPRKLRVHSENWRHPSWGISRRTGAWPQAYRKSFKCFDQAIWKDAHTSLCHRDTWVHLGGYRFGNGSMVQPSLGSTVIQGWWQYIWARGPQYNWGRWSKWFSQNARCLSTCQGEWNIKR